MTRSTLYSIRVGSKAFWQSRQTVDDRFVAEMYQGLWPITTTHGVIERFTAAKSERSQLEYMLGIIPSQCFVLFDSLDLLIVTPERSPEFLLRSPNLIWASQITPEIGLRIDEDDVNHPIVIRIPEVAVRLARISGHPPMVDVSGEVRLPRRADAGDCPGRPCTV